MATAAEAASAAAGVAAEAEGASTGEGAQGGGTSQGGAAGAPGGEGAAGAGGQAPAKPVISETVRLARELKRTQAKLQELEKRGAPAPVQQHAAVSREAVLAELKKQYEEDPETFLQSVAGEDFYAVAKRVQTRNEAPETKIQMLERELAELKGTATGLVKERETEAQKAADKITATHIETVAKEIDATDADGNAKYPTLATLDPDALEEPVALTAYNAVALAWQKECTRFDEATKTHVPFKKWTDKQVEAKFAAAFKALDSHYSKLRTPRSRNPGTQQTKDTEIAPTISTSTSSGLSERPVRPAPGTMSVEQALAKALKEQGLS